MPRRRTSTAVSTSSSSRANSPVTPASALPEISRSPGAAASASAANRSASSRCWRSAQVSAMNSERRWRGPFRARGGC